MSVLGTGPTLASVGLTVTVTVRDAGGLPCVGVPAQDIWLGDAAGGVEITRCPNGPFASGPTNAQGVTTITGRVNGGGWTANGMQVWIAGAQLNQPPLPLVANSADVNGDLALSIVDLAGVPNGFAAAYLSGAYQVSADLNCDGVLNLSDVIEFSTELFAPQVYCP